MRAHLQTRQGERGATLIEILVSILVISLGVLAMVIMQLNTTKFSKTSEYRAMGALLAADLADRMRANHNVADEGTVTAATYSHMVAYPPSSPPTAGTGCNTFTANCTPDLIAAKDIADWRTLVSNSLPQGDAYIAPDLTGAVDLWLIWMEPGSSAEADSKGDASNLDPGGTTTCPENVLATGTTNKGTPKCMYFRINL